MSSAPDGIVQIFKNLLGLLDRRERYLALLMFAVTAVVSMVEVLGVASVMPFMAVLANQKLIHTNWVLSHLYAGLGFQTDDSFLTFLGVSLFFFLIASMVLKGFGFWIQVRFSNNRVHTLGYRLFAIYLRQPYYWYFGRHTSSLSNKILSEVNEVVYGALFPATQVLANGLATLFLLALVVLINPFLAIAAAVLLSGVYGAIGALTRLRLNRLGELRANASRQKFHIVQEALGGVKEVKLAGLERAFLERLREPSRSMAQSNTSAKLIAELPSFVMQGTVFGGLLLVLLHFIRSQGGLAEALPVLAVYAFAGYRLIPALQSIYNQLATIKYHGEVLKTLHDDLRNLEASNAAPAATERDSGTRLGFAQGIELADIQYTYPGSAQPALNGLNIKIPFRGKIGLVGASGSGKTTAVDLLLGLLEPQGGALRVDGKTVTAADLRPWQRNLGYVPQQIYLVDDTIKGNIAFGVPPEEVDMAAVERAAKIANLHDFIVNELADGYDTLVGERGVRLSGGQRQRIGIARSLYRDPEVLILDEATSALDNLTEKAVMEAINNLGNQKTIVLVAHRLTTVQACDCIYLLGNGRVVASGSFDELIEKSPHFKAMAGHS
jgi:ABC-type multidrug transport system fused ATPase/permease subunit